MTCGPDRNAAFERLIETLKTLDCAARKRGRNRMRAATLAFRNERDALPSESRDGSPHSN